MFFADLDDFRKYYTVSASFNFGTLEVYLREVDRSVLRLHLGADFLTELQEAFDAGLLSKENPTAEEEKYIEALELVRRCTPYFALAKWAPSGQLNIDSNGLGITVTDTRKMPWEWQVRNFIDSLNNSGTATLDDLLAYLDANADTFDVYTASDEKKSNRELLVPSSEIFAKYFNGLASSRVTFLKLKSIIRKVEDFEIKPLLLPDYFTELKTAVQDNDALSAEDKKVLDMVQPAIVNLAIARAMTELSASLNDNGFLTFDNTRRGKTIDTRTKADAGTLAKMATAADNDGRAYLKQLRDLLANNLDDYPTYRDDAQRTAETTFESENDGTGGIYSMI